MPPNDDGPAPSDLRDWEEPRRATRCRCGGDMPGRCPGPANCPLCEEVEEEDDDDAAE